MAVSFLNKLILFIGAGAGLAGCTNLFLQPNRVEYPFATALRYSREEVRIPTERGESLRAWLFGAVANQAARPDLVRAPTSKAKGLIVQFHGNAENMTAHFRFLEWAPFEGYDLLAFDYRGYGGSPGVANVADANADARAAIRFAVDLARERGEPLIFYGQSLGGALMLRALEDSPPPQNLVLIVVESAFRSYREIAREKLDLSWLTRPFAWLAYPLVSDRWSPGGAGMKTLPPNVPIIFIYSSDDPIVPINHGVELFAETREPKEFWEHAQPGHVNGMFAEGGRLRRKLLKEMGVRTARRSE